MSASLATDAAARERYQTGFDVANRFRASAPVDLEAMARALGITVDMQAALPGDISGRLRRDQQPGGGSTFSIDVNGSHSLARRRFTLAHEIGHFLLHRDLMQNGAIVDNEMYRSGLPDPLETEANRLAAELLMPPNLVRTLWRAGVCDIARLSRTFGVSEAAMRIRLKQLGYSA